jgi:hypothetical protein
VTDLHLDLLGNDTERIEAIRAYAHQRGAIMAVSSHFGPPGLYWADIIQPGYATIAQATTPLAAAVTAVHRYLAATQPPNGTINTGAHLQRGRF